MFYLAEIKEQLDKCVSIKKGALLKEAGMSIKKLTEMVELEREKGTRMTFLLSVDKEPFASLELIKRGALRVKGELEGQKEGKERSKKAAYLISAKADKLDSIGLSIEIERIFLLSDIITDAQGILGTKKDDSLWKENQTSQRPNTPNNKQPVDIVENFHTGDKEANTSKTSKPVDIVENFHTGDKEADTPNNKQPVDIVEELEGLHPNDTIISPDETNQTPQQTKGSLHKLPTTDKEAAGTFGKILDIAKRLRGTKRLED